MAEEKTATTISRPPNGQFSTMAVLLEDEQGGRSQHSGQMDEGNFLTGGSLYINVMARDPFTGQAARIDGVKVEQTFGTLVSGIPSEGAFILTCPNYEGFKRRDPTGMVAVSKPENKTSQNKSLPEPVKVKDTIDSFSEVSRSPVCKKYNENVNAAQRHLGLIHERDDLQLLQGKQDGQSPGVAVNQGTGAVYLFGNDGKQNASFAPGQGFKMKATSIDQGGAQQKLVTYNYGSMPQTRNPVADVVPQGTILTPQPSTTPDIMAILNMVATIVDMIDLVKACKDAVDVIRNYDDYRQDRELQDIMNEAEGPGTLEEGMMNEEEREELERDSRYNR